MNSFLKNEKKFDASARALAKRVYAEVEGQPLGNRPLLKAVCKIAKHISALQAANCQFKRGIDKAEEKVLSERNALKRAILTLNRKHRFLDRWYDLGNNTETDAVFMFAEAYVARVTYYIEEINQVKRFISEASEAAAEK